MKFKVLACALALALTDAQYISFPPLEEVQIKLRDARETDSSFPIVKIEDLRLKTSLADPTKTQDEQCLSLMSSNFCPS